MIKALLEHVPLSSQNTNGCAQLKEDVAAATTAKAATTTNTKAATAAARDNGDNKASAAASEEDMEASESPSEDSEEDEDVDEEDEDDDDDFDDDDDDDEDFDVPDEALLISSEEEAELEAQRISLHELIGKSLLPKRTGRSGSVSSSSGSSAVAIVPDKRSTAKGKLAAALPKMAAASAATKKTITTTAKTTTPAATTRPISNIPKKRRCQQRINSNGSTSSASTSQSAGSLVAAATTTASRSGAAEQCASIFLSQEHNNKLIFHCTLCSVRYDDLENLSRHLHEAHQQLQQEATGLAHAPRKGGRQQTQAASASVDAGVFTIKMELPPDTDVQDLPRCGTVTVLARRKLFLNCGHCECKYAGLELFRKHLRTQHALHTTVGETTGHSKTATKASKGEDRCSEGLALVEPKTEVKIELSSASEHSASEGRRTPATRTGSVELVAQSAMVAIPEDMGLGLQHDDLLPLPMIVTAAASVGAGATPSPTASVLTAQTPETPPPDVDAADDEDKENATEKAATPTAATDGVAVGAVNDLAVTTKGTKESAKLKDSVLGKEVVTTATPPSAEVKRKGPGRPAGTKKLVKSPEQLPTTLLPALDAVEPAVATDAAPSIPVLKKRKRKSKSKDPSQPAGRRERLSISTAAPTPGPLPLDLTKTLEPPAVAERQRRTSAGLKSYCKFYEDQEPPSSPESAEFVKPAKPEAKRLTSASEKASTPPPPPTTTTTTAAAGEAVADLTANDEKKPKKAAPGRRRGPAAASASDRANATAKRYGCSICGKFFKKKSRLVEHLRIHSGEKPFACDECGKRFRIKMRLSEHQLRHRKIKAFKCDQCDMAMSTKQDMVLHKRHHEGDRRYRCPSCPKAFVRSSDLKIHVRVHTGEKPFTCEVCQRSFRANQNLIVHRRVHMGEKNYKCDHCDRSFTRNIDRKVHLRSHTGEKPYKCEICQKAYSSSYHVRTHIEREHRDNGVPRVRNKPGPKPKHQQLRDALAEQQKLIKELQEQLLNKLKGDDAAVAGQLEQLAKAEEELAAGRNMLELLKNEKNVTPDIKQASVDDDKMDVLSSAAAVLEEMVRDDERDVLATLPGACPPKVADKVEAAVSEKESTVVAEVPPPVTRPIVKRQRKQKQKSCSPPSTLLLASTATTTTTSAMTTTKAVPAKTLKPKKLHKSRPINKIQQVSVTVSMQVEEVIPPRDSVVVMAGKAADNVTVDGAGVDAVVVVDGGPVGGAATGDKREQNERKITTYFTVLGQQAEV